MDATMNIILVIEDDIGLNELICERIQQAGFETFAVFSASEAFEWLKGHDPLMMLLDYSLPDMTGKGLLERINAEGLYLPPFVIATGQGDELIAVEMMKLGAKDYLLKDSNFLEMLPIVITKIAEGVEKEQQLRLAELELKESYRFNRQIIDGAQEGIVVFDNNMRYKVFNPYMEKMTGVPASEVIGKHPQDIFPYLKDSGAIDLIERALCGEILNEVDVPFNIPLSGKSGWTSDKTAPMFNHSGEIIGTITTVHDITERKVAEEALLESQERFRLAIQATHDGIWERNLVTNESVYSPQWCEILGYSYDDPELPHTYQSWAERIHPDDYDRVITALNNYIETGSNYKVEYRHLHKSGEYRWQKSTGTSVLGEDGKVVKIVGCISDISDRKKAEETLKIRETYLTAIIENLPGMIWLKDVDSHILLTNTNFAQTFGREKPEDLFGKTDLDFSPKEHADRYLADDRKVVETKEPLNVEELIFDQNSLKWFETFKMPIFDENNQVIGTTGYSQDISERKKFEKTLSESEEKFRNVFENSIIGKSLTTLDGKVSVNKAFGDIVGYTPEELGGKNWAEFTHKDDIKQTGDEIQSVLKGEKQFSQWEKRYIHKNGSIVWVHISIVLLRDNDGNPIHFITEIYDITNRKQAEEELSKSEERFRMLAENSIDVIWKMSLDGHFTYVSPSIFQLRGYTPEEVLQQTLQEAICPGSISLVQDSLAMALADINVANRSSSLFFPLEQTCKDGTTVWTEVAAKLVRDDAGVLVAIVGVTRNITERRKLELEREQFFKFFEISSDIMVIADPMGAFMKVNPATLVILGYSEMELITKPFVDFVHPDDRQQTIDEMERQMKIGSSINFENRYVCKDGSILWLSWIANFKQDEGITYATARDITLQRQAENALRKSEEMYRNLIQIMPDGVYKSSPEGKFLEVNPAMVDMLGYRSKKELLAIDIKSQLYFDIEDRYSRSSKGKNDVRSIFQLRKKDGSGIWVEDHGWYNYDADGNIIAHEGVLRDVTVRKLAQDQLQENASVLNKLLFANTNFIDSEYNRIDHKKILDNILEISGAKYATFNVFDDNGRDFTTVAVSGIDGLQNKIKSVLGFDLANKKWQYDPIRESKLNDKISTRFESLSELVGYVFPKKLTALVERVFNVGETWVIQIIKKNKTIGDYTLLFERNNTLKNREIVELYATQVGLYIERLNSENLLRQNEEKYRLMFENNPEPMFIYDLETLYFLDVNIAAIHHYGYSREEFLSMTVKDIRPVEEIPALMEFLEYVKQGKNKVWETKHIKKSGEIISVEVITAPVISNGRKAQHALINDITERKLAEEALEEKMNELMSFQRLTVGRELTMIELKKEINDLLLKLGREPKYRIVD
jgi:PAS domain S-box-containing protein